MAKVAAGLRRVWQMASVEANSISGQLNRRPGPGWLGTALMGMAPVAVAAMLAVVFGFLDGVHYASLKSFLMPDPTTAAGTLALAGGVEGVTISIVIVTVVFGIRMTSSRYSPRIIGIFIRNPSNALVLATPLASILYTFLVLSEIKSSYVPFGSVAAAEVLALINFTIPLPYVRYIFEIMRAETLVDSLKRAALHDLWRAAAQRDVFSCRRNLITSIDQIADIAMGSMQLGDMPVCLLSTAVLGQFIAHDYMKVKPAFGLDWFGVGHPELPGESDQIIAEVNRSRTWLEYSVLSSFVHLVALAPGHRKEAAHAVAIATRDVGLAAIHASDDEVAELCIRFFNTYLREALDQSAPTFASTTMNEYRRLAMGAVERRPDLAVKVGEYLLRYGRQFDGAGMPATLGSAAEDVVDLAMEAASRNPEVTRQLALGVVSNLLDLIPKARPIGLNGLFKAAAKLALWALATNHSEVAHILVEGIAAVPPHFVTAALDRMDGMQHGLFWEVNERVVAFDWVDKPLHAQIPTLREALRSAQDSAGQRNAVVPE